MICPFRLETEMNYKKDDKLKVVVCNRKVEKYPECYYEECPYYDITYDPNAKPIGTCHAIEKNVFGLLGGDD